MPEICPYCEIRPILRKTCGHPACQFKRHILQMRTKRKTDRVDTIRRLKI